MSGPALSHAGPSLCESRRDVTSRTAFRTIHRRCPMPRSRDPRRPNDEDAAAERWLRRARVARAWIAVLASAAALCSTVAPALAAAVRALTHALR